jgi:hypothetical protein
MINLLVVACMELTDQPAASRMCQVVDAVLCCVHGTRGRVLSAVIEYMSDWIMAHHITLHTRSILLSFYWFHSTFGTYIWFHTGRMEGTTGTVELLKLRSSYLDLHLKALVKVYGTMAYD